MEMKIYEVSDISKIFENEEFGYHEITKERLENG